MSPSSKALKVDWIFSSVLGDVTSAASWVWSPTWLPDVDCKEGSVFTECNA